MKVVGLILAAGESRRMGTPKALLPYQGETFLDRQIRVLGEACDSVTVVLGHEPERIREGLALAGRAHLVINHEYPLGQLSSLQTGLRAVDADAVLFTPVDLPGFQPQTAQRVADCCRAGKQLAIPRHEGRRGHPVGCDRTLIGELLALPTAAKASDVIHAHLADATYIDVDDSGVLRDADDPAAYRELLRASEEAR